jgi:hypothetical protein
MLIAVAMKPCSRNLEEKFKMSSGEVTAVKSVDSIIWNNWRIVEVLLDRRNDLRDKLLKALEDAMKDDENLSEEISIGHIFGDVKRQNSGNGIVAKFSVQRSLGVIDENESGVETVSLGAIVIDFPTAQDGRISLEILASLPQQRIFGNGLDDAKKHIRNKVEAMSTSGIHEEFPPLSDLENAVRRNDIARKVIQAEEFGSMKKNMSLDDEIENFVSTVVGIYRSYKRIPQWLAELPPV